MSGTASKIFTSYRRVDTGPAVRSLSGILKQAFGPETVFVDTEAVRTGNKWPQQIDEALETTDILLVAIGPAWLRISDEYGRRRLDQEADWVRNEIASSIKRDIHVFPLLIGNAKLPVRAALPDCLGSLVDYPSFELRDEHWERDVSALINRLAEIGCHRVMASIRYPKPHAFPKALSTNELNDVLRRLDKWVLTTSLIPGQEPKTRTELMKSYQFRSFEKAMAFMESAVPFITDLNHHPRWENIFSTVVVWLTSWDIGFKPSRADIELADQLDALYRATQDKIM